MVVVKSEQPSGGRVQQQRWKRKRNRKKRNCACRRLTGFDDLRLYLNAKRMAEDAKKPKLKPILRKPVFAYVKTMAQAEKKKEEVAADISAQMADLSIA